MKQRFRAVEFGIFSLVSLVFLNSVYHLLTDGSFLANSAKKTEVAEVIKPEPVVAKTPRESDFVGYETRCQPSGERYETKAAKLRILGPICGSTSGSRELASAVKSGAPAKPSPVLSHYKIQNMTTRFKATVFKDQNTKTFSTDFIPLNKGQNKIHMEFHYKNGKVYPSDLIVFRR